MFNGKIKTTTNTIPFPKLMANKGSGVVVMFWNRELDTGIINGIRMTGASVGSLQDLTKKMLAEQYVDFLGTVSLTNEVPNG
jgi:hypothetical protein